MTQGGFAQLALNTISAKAKDVLGDIFILPKERRGFAANQRLMVTPVYFYRIIGVQDKGTYENNLLSFHDRLSELQNLYLKLEDGLDKAIDPKMVQKVMPYWMQIERLGILTGKTIVEATLRKEIISMNKDAKNQLLKDKLIILIDLFMKNQTNINIVKNFYIKILYWIQKYATPLLDAYEYGNINPKVLYYGEIQRDEIYFLIFLSLIGCDVIYFHTQDDTRFNEVSESNIYSNVLEFEEKIPLRSFPKAPEVPKVQRRETVAYRASQEIDKILHTEEGGLYRPWQFENYEVFSTPLKTTYEELLILWKEQARFREGFKVESGNIYVPNIFAKISGTQLNLDEYWKNFDMLRQDENMTIFIDKIPMYPSRGYAVSPSIFDPQGGINKERVKALREYRFGYLRSAVQDLILDKIDELIKLDDFFTCAITPAFKAKCLYTILTLDKKYLDLLQKFDYPHQIPKLVIFDGDEQTFTQEDLIIIGFLHFVGFDIAIITPTGYNNIENGINAYYYDVHKLEDFKFDLKPNGRNSRQKKGFFRFF